MGTMFNTIWTPGLLIAFVACAVAYAEYTKGALLAISSRKQPVTSRKSVSTAALVYKKVA